MIIKGAVEGLVDEAVVRSLARVVGLTIKPVYVTGGKSQLLKRLEGYNNAARFAPWLVLVDLDEDAKCAPLFRESLLPTPAARMCFRIAVRAIESWLLADREGIARFLGVFLSKVPQHPESIPDPKAALVQVAARSRKRDIRDDLVPRAGSGRRVGPAYSSRLVEFVLGDRGWNPEAAAQSADSLKRCLKCLRTLA